MVLIKNIHFVQDFSQMNILSIFNLFEFHKLGVFNTKTIRIIG